jgi:hypothetical protein
MSWATSAGVRVLRGPEKELFIFGAVCLYDTILCYIGLKEEDEDEPVSVDYCSEVFNKMPDEEKNALSHRGQAARAMLELMHARWFA